MTKTELFLCYSLNIYENQLNQTGRVPHLGIFTDTNLIDPKFKTVKSHHIFIKTLTGCTD